VWARRRNTGVVTGKNCRTRHCTEAKSRWELDGGERSVVWKAMRRREGEAGEVVCRNFKKRNFSVLFP